MTGRKPTSRTRRNGKAWRFAETFQPRFQRPAAKGSPMKLSIRCGVGLLTILVLGGPAPALACACCTNEGQRNVATVALDSGKREEIESLRFGGEDDVDGIEGIATPSGSYALTAKWRDDQLEFSFRDSLGHTGTLSLTRPNTVSVFEVDPRDRPGRKPTSLCSAIW
jgi:hypothetical protein